MLDSAKPFTELRSCQPLSGAILVSFYYFVNGESIAVH